ncbi:MAG TPA: hypothetical protein PK771_07870 [Spirochaetota bacterium]|nr:hypothetical protein [Spirochaetota bacterium]
MLDKNQVYTVKIYFINPIELIGVVINTLIELEYESYSISEQDKDDLLEIIKKEPRNVIFLSIRNKMEVEAYLKYIEKAQAIQDSQISFGAFVYDSMEQEIRNKFLEHSVSVIDYGDIKNNTLAVMKNILTFFEARGKRLFIRTKSYGIAEAYFYIKSKDNPMTAKITDISAFACSVNIEDVDRLYFQVGDYFNEILFVLGGIRVRTAAKIMGFSKDNKNIFLLKFCTAKMNNGKLIFEETVTPEINRKLHDYIRKCLKDQITSELEEFRNKDNPKENKSKDVAKDKLVEKKSNDTEEQTSNENDNSQKEK